MAFAKFQENRFRIDGVIAENHAILVNLTASKSIVTSAGKVMVLILLFGLSLCLFLLVELLQK